jgi:membrane protease YdiL (CAAX protease family)
MENAYYTYYLITICFSTYFIISYVYKALNLRNLERALVAKKGLLLINLKHVLGILLFGIVFYLIIPDYNYLINTFEVPELNTSLLIFTIAFISALLSFKSVKKNLKNKNEVSNYSLSQGWNYFPIRIVFLLSYEFFFRGVLFFTLLELSGFFLAIMITTLLYVLIHIFDAKKEILGAIPFGVVLCLFSFFTNSIWAAFIIHIALSGVYEVSMFYHLIQKKQKS